MPSLKRLKEAVPEHVSDLANVLEQDIRLAAEPFLDNLRSRFSSLSSREIAVCA